MSIKRIDYGEIFKNSVFKTYENNEKLPPVKLDGNTKMKPEMKRTDVNKSAMAFPNSSLLLDITTEFDHESNNLKYVFMIKNVEKENHRELEGKLTNKISDEVKKFALKQIIDDRRKKNDTPNNMRGIKYKPYKLSDYKQHFVQDIQKPLGGIGANVGTQEWSEKAERRSKMINFAKEAENTNKYRFENSKSTPSAKFKIKRIGIDKTK